MKLYKDPKEKESEEEKDNKEDKDKEESIEVHSGDEGFIGPRRKNSSKNHQQGQKTQPQHQNNLPTKNKFGTLAADGDKEK